MKKLLFALLGALLIVSCEEKQKTYLDRDDSVYLMESEVIDLKIVLHRPNRQYEVYQRYNMYNHGWELEDKGKYEESIDGDIVTCELDNDYVKRNGGEKLGTIFRVKIDLSLGGATFSSIVGKDHATDITNKQ